MNLIKMISKKYAKLLKIPPSPEGGVFLNRPLFQFSPTAARNVLYKFSRPVSFK